MSRRVLLTFAGWGLLAATLSFSALAGRFGLSTPLSLDGALVVAVSPGSYAWNLGIRPGDAYESVDSDDGAAVRVTTSSGPAVTVGLTSRVETDQGIVVGLGLALLSLVLSRAGMPGGNVLLGTAAALGVSPFMPALGLPAGIAVATVVVAVSLVAVGSRPGVASQLRSRFMWSSLAAASLLLTLVIAWLAPEPPWPWTLVWAVPLAAAVLIPVVFAAPTISRVVRSPGTARSRVDAIVTSEVPAVSQLRFSTSERERARLAAELHNSVLPELAQVAVHLGPTQSATRVRLDAVMAGIRDSLSERQTTVLRHAGLAAATKSYVERLSSAVPVTLEATGSKTEPSFEVSLATYRIAQLAISNALAHSGADEVVVELDIRDDRVALNVIDDGVGLDDFARQAAVERGSIGLTEMDEIARAVNGVLHVVGHPDRGTTVAFVWNR